MSLALSDKGEDLYLRHGTQTFRLGREPKPNAAILLATLVLVTEELIPSKNALIRRLIKEFEPIGDPDDILVSKDEVKKIVNILVRKGYIVEENR